MNINALRDVVILSVVCLAVAAPAFPQTAPEVQPEQPPDQISQLAEVAGLSEEQEAEIRATVDEYQPKIEALQVKTQQAQLELQDKAGPDFDEKEIRESADRYGELAGELLALNVIMQSSIESVFTDEQRQTLEARMQQQQQEQQQQEQRLQEELQRELQRQQGQQENPGS
jgi:Spy/CpxP family protein refolding chaperone